MSYLKHSEFIHLAPENPGFVRVNHDSDECAGSSKSLKIERKEDGSINAHCFRCGRSGLYSPEFKRVKEAQNRHRKAPVSSGGAVNDLPKDVTDRTGDWPLYAIKWLRQWGITNEEIRENGISYSPYYDRLCFRVDYCGDYAGYASRAVNPTDTRPKWLRFTDGRPWFKRSGKEESGVLVLVEDIVSAIKVYRHADCIALMTTTISTNIMPDLSGYDRYLVWLDDDNRQVKLNQLKLARRLSILGKTEVVHLTDPKRCSNEDLQIRIRES